MNKIMTITAAVAGSLLLAMPAYALSLSAGIDSDLQLDAPAPTVSTQASAQTLSSATGSADASASGAIPLVVTQDDVSAKAEGSVSAPTDITTREQLSDFVSAQVRADPQLSAVDTASDHVAVTYQEPGAFLGVIPILVQTTVTTDASGNVSITHPWWGTLSASYEADLQSRAQAAVDSVLGADAGVNAQLSLSQQAQLESAIEGTMTARASQRAGSH